MVSVVLLYVKCIVVLIIVRIFFNFGKVGLIGCYGFCYKVGYWCVDVSCYYVIMIGYCYWCGVVMDCLCFSLVGLRWICFCWMSFCWNFFWICWFWWFMCWCVSYWWIVVIWLVLCFCCLLDICWYLVVWWCCFGICNRLRYGWLWFYNCGSWKCCGSCVFWFCWFWCLRLVVSLLDIIVFWLRCCWSCVLVDLWLGGYRWFWLVWCNRLVLGVGWMGFCCLNIFGCLIVCVVCYWCCNWCLVFCICLDLDCLDFFVWCCWWCVDGLNWLELVLVLICILLWFWFLVYSGRVCLDWRVMLRNMVLVFSGSVGICCGWELDCWGVDWCCWLLWYWWFGLFWCFLVVLYLSGVVWLNWLVCYFWMRWW